MANQSITQTYRPFSNGTEAEDWLEHNCYSCKFYTFEGSPVCPGDEGITLAYIGDGELSEAICDFIGTREREKGYCKLAGRCRHWAHPESDLDMPTLPNPNQLSLF